MREVDLFRDNAGDQNQWLQIELRLCRAVFGLSQRELSEISHLGLQTIKNMEKPGASPRAMTVGRLRYVFSSLGLSFYVDKEGSSHQKYSPELLIAIDSGELGSYLKKARMMIELKDNFNPAIHAGNAELSFDKPIVDGGPTMNDLLANWVNDGIEES